MASPSIPTSFVPHLGAPTGGRKQLGELSAVLGWVAYTLLGVSVLLAAGVFAYGQALDATRKAKDAQIADAAKKLDLAHVSELIRLHDRLLAADKILNGHDALSKFYGVIESAMPTTIRFTTMTTVFDGTTLKFNGSGVAKNFNALAFASSAFAKNVKIKNAIFSNIAQNSKDSTIVFTLDAGVDPSVIAYTP